MLAGLWLAGAFLIRLSLWVVKVNEFPVSSPVAGEIGTAVLEGKVHEEGLLVRWVASSA